MASTHLPFFNPAAHQPHSLAMFSPPTSISLIDEASKVMDPRFSHMAFPSESTVSSTTTPVRAAYPSEAVPRKDLCSPPSVSLAVDTAAFYQASLGSVAGMPSSATDSYKTPGWSGSYDQAMVAPYFYHPGYVNGFDPNNAVRRKNATRETTSALKAWLFEHRKNPYPTKAEKIMLAIITRMTLTQVSTWFANARRRLKKETKFWNSTDKDSFMADDDKDDENDSFDSETKEMSSARAISSFEKETGRMRKLSGSCSDGSFPETSDISDTELNDDVMEDSEKLIVVDDQISPLDSASTSVITANYFSDAIASESQKSSSKECSSHHSVSSSERLAASTSNNNTSPRNDSKSPSTSRPKIWSIANIIGDSSSTKSESTESADVTSSSSNQ